jgi:O-antigen/teichoic acid export membrane protein
MKLRGPVILTLTLAAGQVVGLVRTVLVARFLGTEIQGEAIAIGLCMGLLISLITLHGAWQLVQSRQEDLDGLQSTLQGTGIIRGVLAFLLVITTGPFFLDYVEQPQLIIPLLVIGLCPIIEGCTHLDPWRDLREGSYRSFTIAQAAGPIGGAIAAVIALMVTRDIWAAVIIQVSITFSRMFGTHLVAKRRWSCRIHRTHLRPVIGFMLPLIPAGLLFWLNSHSDQILMFLGTRSEALPDFSLGSIGAYGTVAGLILLPRGTIVTALQSVLVPRLAEVQGDELELRRRSLWTILFLTGLAVLIVILGVFAGDAVFRVGLGTSFDSGANVASVLIGAFAIQLFRTYCYESSIAMGRTSVHLVGNVFRLSSMGFAIILLMDGQGVEGLALSVLLGELTSTAVAGLWLMFTGQRQSWPVLPAAILTGLFIFLSEPLTVYTREISPTLRLAVVAGTAALISLGAAIVFRRRIAGFVNGFIR